jgi:excinuclease ABC subunit A
VRHYGREPTCPVCGATVRRPTPALFSFNSPLGACDTCQGFGRVIGIDRERVVPDPRAPWSRERSRRGTRRPTRSSTTSCTGRRGAGVPLDVPWQDLDPEHREWVWSGGGDFCNLDDFFAWLENRLYKVHVRVLLARYRSYDPAPTAAARG